MQPTTSSDSALRKHTQIARANRVMFGWVAVVSVIVGFALVGAIFLTQRLLFNEKVLAVKNNTITTLKSNIAAVPGLEANVRVLDTNDALASVKASPDDQTIQVILDALPSSANSLALGASLQSMITGVSGITLVSQQVTPVAGVEQLDSSTSIDDTQQVAATNATSGDNEIDFTFSVSGNQDALKQVLTQLERSIRTITVTNLHVQSQGTTELMTVTGHAYYQPAQTVQLNTEVVRP